MDEFLTISQIVISVILIGLILIQVRGVGFGRSGGMAGSNFTRRGLEKFVFKFTFVIAFFFIIMSALQIVL